MNYKHKKLVDRFLNNKIHKSDYIKLYLIILKNLIIKVFYNKYTTYYIINNFQIKHPSLFWSVRSYIRRKDPFKYWTIKRRIEENCCPKCGVINDNSPYWKRNITFEKRDNK